MTAGRTKGVARPIRLFGDPVLRTPTDEVVDFDESLARLVDDMFVSMYAAEGVGLAANQIGVSLSVFVYDCPDASGERHVGHVVNPRLVSTGGELDEDLEGCLSIPGLHYETARASYAAVEGVDMTGAPGTGSSPAACSTRRTTCTACCSSTACTAGPSARRCARSCPPTGPTASVL